MAGLGMAAAANALGEGLEEAEEEEEEVEEGAEEGEAHLSKRAAKKQRKRELSEASAVAETPIDDSSFGHRMLLSMGWRGTGAPLQQGGIAEPVKANGVSARHKGLIAAEDEELLAATEASVRAEAAAAKGGTSSKRQRRADEPAAAQAAQDAEQLASLAPRVWLVTVEMARPSDEVDVRKALGATKGVKELRRVVPLFE